MSSSEKPKIEAVFVLEILGRPKEHLIEVLEDIIKKMSEEKGVSLVNKKIPEPIESKEKKDFFATHAEVELEVEEPFQLAVLMFKYMPSHIEIVSPENLTISNNDFSDMLSEITRRLHSYDELMKMIQFENARLTKKVQELSPKDKEDSKENKK
ncbi:MAG: hypothetical protein KC516_03465 [Nanoarchaeota archaeon]|nr:hypothetical protein [Nanoarchaeota archaeon]